MSVFIICCFPSALRFEGCPPILDFDAAPLNVSWEQAYSTGTAQVECHVAYVANEVIGDQAF
jgi:hypothetical protein